MCEYLYICNKNVLSCRELLIYNNFRKPFISAHMFGTTSSTTSATHN